MNIVTTRYGGGPVKPFSWSYSRLKNYESCPKRHWHLDIAKDIKEEEGEALQWGNAVHKALADRISKGAPLPKGMGHFEKWVERIAALGNKAHITVLMTEQQLAIDANFGPTQWFSSDAKKKDQNEPWYRGIADVIKVVGPAALVVDWKTGKIIEDSQQLALMAACVFAHHPEITRIRSEFIWLKDDASSRADFHRDEMAKMWKNIWPRVEALKIAHETTNYPAKPGYLCKRWCPVKACPHNGK